MERRELIKLVTLATGAAVTIPLSSAVLTACSKIEPKDASNYLPDFFSDEDFELLQHFLDFILPKTETPSAVEVGVHQMMDSVVGTIYNKEQQIRFSAAWDLLKPYCVSKDEFDKIKEVLASSAENDKKVKKAFVETKQQALTYYLSTKEIAINYLNYLPIPGKYEACIELESVDGKAWAL